MVLNYIFCGLSEASLGGTHLESVLEENKIEQKEKKNGTSEVNWSNTNKVYGSDAVVGAVHGTDNFLTLENK